MEMVGEMQEKVWFRCSRCHHSTLVNMKSLEGDQKDGKLDAITARRYSPEQIFNIGEAIFHSEWNDVGRVINKIKTSDGNQAIIVSFEKQGQRRLIENLKPEPSPEVANSNGVIS